MKKILILTFLAALVLSCNQGQQEAASGSKEPGSRASATLAREGGGAVLARVNNVPITEQAVLEELEKLPPQVRQVFSAQGGMKALFEEILKKELLTQEARTRKYSSDPKFKTREKDFRERLMIEFLLEDEVEKKATVSDEDARKYYDENTGDFEVEDHEGGEKQKLEFKTVKDLIKRRLLSGKQQETFEAFVKSLRTKYLVEVDEEAVMKSFGVSEKPPGT